ncbi:hypothetical protein GCM10009760_02290 [Kitasatospora kazusensis]|uniref:Lipoprotein n=1 Tax=Kitasatospora kazusensis TaxID=407974 RepID=A0ABP5KCN5_9ACTN
MAVAVFALSALVLSGCSSEKKDPRAYPGSPAGQTLEGVLKTFGLQLPPCEVQGVGYSGSSKEPYQKLSLSFRAPKACVDQYLRDHSADPGKPAHWSPGADPKAARLVSDADAAKYGWSFDGATKYELFTGFATANQSTFAVLVDPRDPVETVYLDSTYLGGSS